MAWLTRRATTLRRVAMPFEPLLWLFAGVASLSLVLVVAMPDPRIDLDASTMVSVARSC